MSDQETEAELEALRARVAELEATRDKPVKVEVEGLEGIKQLSHAIETQQLDRFMTINSVPDSPWMFLAKGIAMLLVAFLFFGWLATGKLF